jgi:hypothetical protein
MLYVYFINPVTPVILEWDGESQELPNVNKFPITRGVFPHRYTLVNDQLVDRFIGKSDMEAAILYYTSLGSPQVAPPVGFILTPV